MYILSPHSYWQKMISREFGHSKLSDYGIPNPQLILFDVSQIENIIIVLSSYIVSVFLIKTHW